MDQSGIDQGAARTAAELRVQLAQMTMASQMLEHTARDDRSRDYLAILNQGICRMLRTVGRLELSCRLSAEGPSGVDRVLTDLSRVARELGERMGRLLEWSGVELTVDAPKVLLAAADESLIRQMLMELTANGAKEGKHVRISLAERGGWALFTVEDDGPGVDPERLQFLFSGAEEAVPDWRRGGVGVAVARRVAALHGGTLVADCAPGRGLRVAASIPLGNVGPDLLREPGASWDQGGFDEEMVALSGVLPPQAFRPIN